MAKCFPVSILTSVDDEFYSLLLLNVDCIMNTTMDMVIYEEWKKRKNHMKHIHPGLCEGNLFQVHFFFVSYYYFFTFISFVFFF